MINNIHNDNQDIEKIQLSSTQKYINEEFEDKE